MNADLFRAQNAGVRAFASEMGCDPASFAREELTVCPRPEPPLWAFVAMIIGFGTGTVVCAERSYVDWVQANAPQPHVRANYLVFLNPFVAEGARRGQPLEAQTPGLGWALAKIPPELPAPAGLRLEKVDAAWMAEWQPKNIFKNGIGEAHESHRTFRNQFAFALFDEMDSPVAVAGAFDTAGMLEIGIDVVREDRGRNLAPVAVGAAVLEILALGKTPFYGCAATNIRSQRTALAGGFLPACSMAYVVPAGVY